MVTPDYQQVDLIRSVKFKAGVSFTPPVNYCIDPKLVQDTENAGFAVVLPCLDAVEEVQGGFTTITVVLNEAAYQTAGDISGVSVAEHEFVEQEELKVDLLKFRDQLIVRKRFRVERP